MFSGVLNRNIGLKLVKLKTIFDIIITMIHKVKISFFSFLNTRDYVSKYTPWFQILAGVLI